ncbi:hypothetical protein [Bowdeniella nasicola]|uniref:hypothetical protein n=1 Tax=Bowdeniella nasicola TaxID=208480 RepID=UPI0013010B20|nr:hypothetical protein [Bowdeniella nasicola]
MAQLVVVAMRIGDGGGQRAAGLGQLGEARGVGVGGIAGRGARLRGEARSSVVDE